ncbi:MAG: RNA-binding S4 domain-containing protein [Alphaproteobacteria bacterium]
MIASDAAPERAPEHTNTERAKTRLDQWLWFARFVKSRSLAARLCAAGAVTINGSAVRKANQTVRVGDIVILPQGGWQRTVRVLALGARRGPASEARTLYEEAAAALRLSAVPPDWVPLLDSGEIEGVGPPPPS